MTKTSHDATIAMSELGHKRTSSVAVFMSAPRGEADVIGMKADIGALPGGHGDLVVAVALAVWLAETA